MAAAGQLLPSLASGIPQTLLPPSGIVPPLLGMMPGITPYPNIMPTGMLPSNMSYPPGLGGAVMPPPQLLAAAAAAATLQPPLIVPQTSLPSSLLLPPQIEAYNLHPVDNPVEKRLKRKQSNRCVLERFSHSLSMFQNVFITKINFVKLLVQTAPL